MPGNASKHVEHLCPVKLDENEISPSSSGQWTGEVVVDFAGACLTSSESYLSRCLVDIWLL